MLIPLSTGITVKSPQSIYSKFYWSAVSFRGSSNPLYSLSKIVLGQSETVYFPNHTPSVFPK